MSALDPGDFAHDDEQRAMTHADPDTPTACICDGGAYEVKDHPFLVHPDCPVHRPDTPTCARCARCGSRLREIGTPPTLLCDNTEGCPGNRDARGETRQP